MFITGFAAVTLNADMGGAKEAKVLSKPFHLKDLVMEVDRLLANEPRLNPQRENAACKPLALPI